MTALVSAHRKTIAVFAPLIIVLAVGAYLVPHDSSQVSVNPTFWIIFSAIFWAILCASATSQFKVLRSLDMPQKRWQIAAHGFAIVGSVIFGLVAAAAHYIAVSAGVDVDSSFEVAVNGDTGTLPTWLAHLLSVLAFLTTYLVAGYAGTAIGMLFKALDNRSIAMRTITAAGGILLVYFLAIAINWAAYTFSIPIEAPYPGLFIFSGIAIIVSVVLMWRLHRHIHP